MNEDKVIEQIARPIIEQLKKLDNSEIQKKWNQIPKIHFVRDDGMEDPLVIDGVEINDEFIEKLEAYVQEELEMLEKPTILH
ncbi:hypothetical protein H5983_02475 [Faecalitalea cylindroides]|uniref:hypothetical protein n=1 Tax=Faecalitalea cylindroides TaxID=39483 RepID=UPI00195A0AA0|nr:hypothetical protein [Faecalitalea cylindroides]MBM6809945.1 hypothetical protein [Faecalitalea cylindroides]